MKILSDGIFFINTINNSGVLNTSRRLQFIITLFFIVSTGSECFIKACLSEPELNMQDTSS